MDKVDLTGRMNTSKYISASKQYEHPKIEAVELCNAAFLETLSVI